MKKKKKLNHCEALEICSCVLLIIYVYSDVLYNALWDIILFVRIYF